MSPEPHIIVVAPPKNDRSRDEQMKQIRQHCERRGWGVKFRRTSEVRSLVDGDSNRRFRILEPADAHEIYRKLHSAPHAVLQISSCRVLLDPESGPQYSNNTISVETFVRYKCAFSNVRPEDNVTTVLDGLAEDLEVQWCRGERDALCLPLHTFSPKKEWPSLHRNDEVVLFERVHGTPKHRRDAAGREWQVATAMHGGDSAYIGGTHLRDGFHWDVQGVGEGGRIFNSQEVWRLGQDEYLNISPNAHIRAGSRSHTGTRVYESERPDPQLDKAKTKKKGGRQKR